MKTKLKAKYYKRKGLIWEFIRYCFVGGTAFVFDYATYVLFIKLIFIPSLGKDFVDSHFYIDGLAITAGFIVGLTINYILSIVWVFTTEKQQKQGKNVRAFIIFAIIGVIGYFLKIGLMKIGIDFLCINRYIMNFVSAGLVLIWNYLARKFIIFKDSSIS